MHRIIGPSLPSAQSSYIYLTPFSRHSFTTVASNITFKPTELTSVQDKRCIGTVSSSFDRLFMVALCIYRLTISNALYLLEEGSHSSQVVTFGSTTRPRWVQVVDIMASFVICHLPRRELLSQTRREASILDVCCFTYHIIPLLNFV